jgi:hypothetical protein
MDARRRAVRQRERRLAGLERLAAASAEKCGRLQADIQAIKAQKARQRSHCACCLPSNPPLVCTKVPVSRSEVV